LLVDVPDIVGFVRVDFGVSPPSFLEVFWRRLYMCSARWRCDARVLGTRKYVKLAGLSILYVVHLHKLVMLFRWNVILISDVYMIVSSVDFNRFMCLTADFLI
jgi:hypothetical protein